EKGERERRDADDERNTKGRGKKKGKKSFFSSWVSLFFFSLLFNQLLIIYLSLQIQNSLHVCVIELCVCVFVCMCGLTLHVCVIESCVCVCEGARRLVYQGLQPVWRR